MKCAKMLLTRHALQRMFERGISPEDVQSAVLAGDIIESYPDDAPYLSALLLGRIVNRPLHVVVAQDPATGECYVVTAYEPEADLWSEDFRTWRQS